MAASAAMSAAVCTAARALTSAPTSTATTPTIRMTPARASATRVAPPSSAAVRRSRELAGALPARRGCVGRTVGAFTGRPGPVGAGLSCCDRCGLDRHWGYAEGQADGQLHGRSDSGGSFGRDRDPRGAPQWERGPGRRQGSSQVAADRSLSGRLARRTLREHLVARQSQQAHHGQGDRDQERDRRSKLDRGRPGIRSEPTGHRAPQVVRHHSVSPCRTAIGRGRARR